MFYKFQMWVEWTKQERVNEREFSMVSFESYRNLIRMFSITFRIAMRENQVIHRTVLIRVAASAVFKSLE